MRTLVIGDVQGCYKELLQWLRLCKFKSDQDRLWFVGDMVNRGPQSLEVLRFIKSLNEQAITVLGNHDLHLLALAHGVGKPRRLDTFERIWQAADCDSLLDWLQFRPLMHIEPGMNVAMVHAGLSVEWELELARILALEAEQHIVHPSGDFFRNMYGDQPDQWSAQLSGWERVRYIVNCFTRLRMVDSLGRIDLRYKGPPDAHGQGLPWFKHPMRKNTSTHIIFGHWSALGLYHDETVTCLDGGCLWGGGFAGMDLAAPGKFIKLQCQQKLAMEGS